MDLGPAGYKGKEEEKMKRVIITGATGAVGTAIIRELIKNNIEVLVLCREGSKRNSQIPKNKLVKLRYCSLDELQSLKSDGSTYDVFYHLAWAGTTGQARDDMYLQNQNVRYALDAVAAAKRMGCTRFIGVGSQAEYGRIEGLIKPDTPTNPTMGYGIGKLAAGLMTRQYARQIGLEHIWVRIVSVYGPNDGPQSMVMSTINKLKSGEVPQLTKGEQMWDYLYSGDAGRAFVRLGEKGISGKTYVLGSGNVRPLKEYVKDIRDVVAPDMDLAFGAIEYYPHQVMHLQADISELKKDTGWEPKMPFRDGIKSVLNQKPFFQLAGK